MHAISVNLEFVVTRRLGVCLLEKRSICGVVERAQHSCNVLQRRALLTPIFEGTSRLSLEIDDDEIASREENLAEMIVAMDAGEHRREIDFAKKLKALAGLLFKFEHFVGFSLYMLRHSTLASAQHIEING